MMEELAQLTGIQVRVAGRTILDGADLSVHPGEVLAIVGPNGAGKSTLLKVLAGVMPTVAGQVALFQGAEARRQSWARAVAYLPQDFHPHWRISVADLIGLGRSRGVGLLSWRQVAEGQPSPSMADLKQWFALDALWSRPVQALSGGERARVALAWALAGGGRILAADEPIASLDPAQQVRTLDTLRRLRQHIASVVVLHDLNLAARFADRIAVIAEGRCVLCGLAQDVMMDLRLDTVFGIGFQRVKTAQGWLLSPEQCAVTAG